MPECIDCKHCDMKADRANARAGTGHCDFETMVGRFVNVTWPRECEKFDALPAEQSQARRDWLKGKR
jgi:hypothetical protein